MKTSVHVLAIIVALLAATPAIFASDFVRIDGKLSTEHDDPKDGFQEVVKKNLVAVLTGPVDRDIGQLTIKTIFYADDLDANKLVVEKEMLSQVSLLRGRARVEVPSVIFRFTPTHGEITGSGRRSIAKRIESSGRRYHGWGIQVYKGDDIIGEAYSNPSLKPKQ